MRHIIHSILVNLGAFYFAIDAASAASHQQKSDLRPCSTKLTSALVMLKNANAGRSRYDNASQATHLLMEGGPDCIKDIDIVILRDLLQDPDSSMNFWSAVMLRSSGPKARSAIPELYSSYAKHICDATNQHAAAAIQETLEKLDAEVPSITCK